MIHCEIRPIAPEAASHLAGRLMTQLPEWFAIPEANARYQQGILSRLSLAIYDTEQAIGLITLESAYPNNVHIYWIAVSPQFHGMGAGAALVLAAAREARAQGAESLTVETLSPVVKDSNYLKTYDFYLSCGFKPLFDLRPYIPEWPMVYMYKTL